MGLAVTNSRTKLEKKLQFNVLVAHGRREQVHPHFGWHLTVCLDWQTYGPQIPDRMGIWKCWFLTRGENRIAWTKNSRSKGREPTTWYSTYIWRWVQESNPGHIGGRRVLSPLRHPCSPICFLFEAWSLSKKLIKVKRDNNISISNLYFILYQLVLTYSHRFW